MTDDFYDLLEISSDASQDEIKDAYREKVRVYHPDVNDDDRARAQFTAVKKAYEILGDPVERRAYDRLGHEDYVAKRTSGIPSPDVWKRSEDGSSSRSSSGSTSTSTGTTTSSSSTRSRTAGSSGTTSGSSARGTGRSGTETSTSSTGRGRTDSSRTTSDETETGSKSSSETTDRSTTTGSSGTSTSSSTGGSRTTSSSGTEKTASSTKKTTSNAGKTSSTGKTTGTAGKATSDGGRTARAVSSGTTGTTARTSTASSGGRFADNAAVRWWRRQNFSLPLIWLSVLIYLSGLVQFALTNVGALAGVVAELGAVGTDVEGIWTTLTEVRHGVGTPFEFVAGLELVAPPVASLQWYAGVAGIVVAAVGIVAIDRVVRRDDTWEPISIDETIFLSVALATATTLVGGPLLAGAVLMPFLFTVIVHQTRLKPGWKPSYLYVLPVLAPAISLVVFATDLVGTPTLAVDLLAFVILPLAGAFGLPLRATIRKHFGR